MATPTRGQFTDTFKAETVCLTRESGQPMLRWLVSVALQTMCSPFRGEQQQMESKGCARQAVWAEQDELTRLKRDNETLKKEREFLRRAVAIFARSCWSYRQKTKAQN